MNEYSADCCSAAGKTLKETFPEILDYVKISPTYAQGVFSIGDVHFMEERVNFCTESLFKVFSSRLLEGDPGNVLKGPNKIVISKSTARKYFRDENALGKFLTWQIKKASCTNPVESLRIE